MSRLPANCLVTRASSIMVAAATTAMRVLCEHFHKAVKLSRNSVQFGHGPRPSDPSCAAEPDRHVAVVDDDRNRAPPLAELQHSLQFRRVFLDVDVLDLDMPPLVVVTGGLRIRSRVLAEDIDHTPNCNDSYQA